MANQWTNVLNQSNPASEWVLAVASAADIDRVPRAILCVATGNITIVDAKGNSMTLTAPPTSLPLPYMPVKVTAVSGEFRLLY